MCDVLRTTGPTKMADCKMKRVYISLGGAWTEWEKQRAMFGSDQCSFARHLLDVHTLYCVTEICNLKKNSSDTDTDPNVET